MPAADSRPAKPGSEGEPLGLADYLAGKGPAFPTTEGSNMAKALRGDPVEITLARLHEMREQCVAGAMYTPGLPGWMHWHWVAVLNEVIAKRAAPEPDAERYRWLRDTAPETLCAIAWRVKAACGHSEPDAAIDGARLSTTKEAEHG